MSLKVGAPSLLVVVYFQSVFWKFTNEDSYISMRYARALANGDGLVFNVGEKVEGYSNFLWTILLSLSSFVNADVVFNSKVLGAASFLGVLLFSVFILRKLGIRGAVASGFAALVVASNASLSYYATCGLETVFYGFLLTSALYFWMARNDLPAGFPLAVGATASAALTRPEGILFLLLLVAFRIAEHIRGHSLFCRKDIISILTGAAVITGFLLFRYAYYGDLLPNTFYAKSQDWIAGRPFPFGGIDYANVFHQRNGGPFLIPLILLLLRQSRRRWDVLFGLGIIACGFVFVLYANMDWMTNERFLVPYIPVIYTLALAAVLDLMERVPLSRGLSFAVMLIVVVLFGGDQFSRVDYMARSIGRYPLNLMSCAEMDDIGKDLGRLYHGRGVLATKRVGAVPFYSGLKTIDAYGLVDKDIATIYHLRPPAGRTKIVMGTLFKKKPSLVMVYTKTRLKAPQTPTLVQAKSFERLDKALFEEVVKRHFKLVKIYKSGSAEWAYLYEKPASGSRDRR